MHQSYAYIIVYDSSVFYGVSADAGLVWITSAEALTSLYIYFADKYIHMMKCEFITFPSA